MLRRRQIAPQRDAEARERAMEAQRRAPMDAAIAALQALNDADRAEVLAMFGLRKKLSAKT